MTIRSLARQDIQSLSPLHRVPVILVFTHMDKFETREREVDEGQIEIPKYSKVTKCLRNTSPLYFHSTIPGVKY